MGLQALLPHSIESTNTGETSTNDYNIILLNQTIPGGLVRMQGYRRHLVVCLWSRLCRFSKVSRGLSSGINDPLCTSCGNAPTSSFRRFIAESDPSAKSRLLCAVRLLSVVIVNGSVPYHQGFQSLPMSYGICHGGLFICIVSGLAR